MVQKNYQMPEFQVVRQDLANVKFYASSTTGGGITLTTESTGDWF